MDPVILLLWNHPEIRGHNFIPSRWLDHRFNRDSGDSDFNRYLLFGNSVLPVFFHYIWNPRTEGKEFIFEEKRVYAKKYKRGEARKIEKIG